MPEESADECHIEQGGAEVTIRQSSAQDPGQVKLSKAGDSASWQLFRQLAIEILPL